MFKFLGYKNLDYIYKDTVYYCIIQTLTYPQNKNLAKII